MGVPEEDRALVLAQSNIVLSGGDPELIENQDDPLTAFLEAGMALAGVMERLAAERLERPTRRPDHRAGAVGGRRRAAHARRDRLVLHPAAGRRQRDHPQRHHPGRARPVGAPGAARPLGGRPVADPHRGRGDRALGQPDHLDAADGDPGRRAGGLRFRAGDKFLLFYAAANRDPAVFADPHVFDLARDPNPHVGFGGRGPHFCLGAHLARREIAVTFQALFDQLPDLEVTGEPDRLRSSFVNGIKRLPARLTGAR